MNHIYFGITLSLICLFLLYYILPKFILVTVLCAILAGLFFKDDFILFRYIAAHVASFYSWIFDFFLGIQNMYHQSNNTNFPIRKSVINNGSLARKYDRLDHGSSYNLSTSVTDSKPLNSGVWDSGSVFSPPLNTVSKTHATLQEMSKLKIGYPVRRENSTSEQFSRSYNSSSTPISPLMAHTGYSKSDLSRSGPLPFSPSRDMTTNIENKPPINAKLYADVTSPGFCGRVADRLHEESMTHQSKYDTVGSFPVVNLKSHSPKIKIKTPVRVRLAPPSNELGAHYNYGSNNLSRSPVVGHEDSMKSVLQVLKEISRKRIHSHIDEDSEEGTKRLRVTDSQFNSDGLLHTSLLQQTIQGKRAREETSPNEDDKKRRKASLRNNEILSSLSSSIHVRPPHLQSSKRKAQLDDSITSTPVLGKLLKVQKETTPPTPSNHITAPDSAVLPTTVEASTTKTSPSLVIPPVVPATPAAPVPVPAKTPPTETPEGSQPQDDGAVSRLLGRMSDQTAVSRPAHIPVKKNVFMATNDLSLSPPKENRLAAMIAVLGGPSEQSELEGIQAEAPKQSERVIKGKALFMSPETSATPETPKQNKKVTFSDSLTSTKIFERDDADKGNPNVSNSTSLTPPATPLSSFNASGNTTATSPKLNFGSENTSITKPLSINFNSSPLPSGKETPKSNESANFLINAPTSSSAGSVASPGSQLSMFQTPSTNLVSAAVSSTGVAGPTFSTPVTGSNSNFMSTPASGGFSFGTNNALSTTGKESSPKQNASSTTVKTFSFGAEPKVSQNSTSVSGIPSLFPTVSKNETSTPTDAGTTAGQNKPVFNIFGNKDSPSLASKNESENKPIVNGFAPTPSNSSPFTLGNPINQQVAGKTPSFESNSNTTSQSASPFSFGSTTPFSTSSTAVTTQQPTSSIFTNKTQQSSSGKTVSFQANSIAPATPSLNIFSSSTSSPSAQNKPNAFGSGTQGTPTFGESIFKPVSSNSQPTQTNSMFGSTLSQSSGFGSSPALQNGVISSSGASQNGNNIFGNMSSTTNKPITFGGGANTTTQPSTTSVFGFTGTTAPNQTSSPFGITLNSTTSSTPAMFGNTTTAQSTPAFGSGTASVVSQSSSFPTASSTVNQPSLFGNVSNDASKSVFANAPNSTFGGLSSTQNPAFSNPTSSFGNQNNASSFGGQNNTATPAFGSQTNSIGSTFGSQNTTAASTFGNSSTPAFSFGSQNSASKTAQGGFATSGSFGGSSSNANEAKPPAFGTGSGSPFMFGSASAGKPTEAVKPLGTAPSFAFGSSGQQNSTVNPAQTTLPSFGAPTPTFGGTQPAPAFGGTSQSAAPAFQFGPSSSSTAAPAFQFNAAPPTAGGGMFSIGSGGSSTSRPKSTAIRRNYKRT